MNRFGRLLLDSGQRRRLANAVIVAGLIGQVYLYLDPPMRSYTCSMLDYTREPGTAIAMLRSVGYPALATLALAVCLFIHERSSPWLSATIAPVLSITAMTWLAMGALLDWSLLDTIMGCFRKGGPGFWRQIARWVPSLFDVHLCAISSLIGCRRAWKHACSRWSTSRNVSVALASMVACYMLLESPGMIARHVERTNLDAILSDDRALADAGIERLRPWVPWTDLASLRSLACGPEKDVGQRAAFAYQLLTGANPRVAYLGAGR